VPGAEGWRSMYPYFTRFQPEDDNRFWFYNAMHFPEPMPAFDVASTSCSRSASTRTDRHGGSNGDRPAP
jgi:pyruvate,water dikinase